MMRHCPKCGNDLPAEYFPKDSSKPHGLSSYCKTCRVEYQRLVRSRGKANLKPLKPGFESEAQSGGCDICNNFCECSYRVTIGAWVMCEQPDAADLYRIQLVSPASLAMMLDKLEVR